VDKEVFLGIYTLSGRLVRVLADNDIEISEVIHTKKWNGRDDDGAMVGSGTYLVHLRAGGKYNTVNVCFIR
jgi:flagellar hook assembly protein FlgD